MARFRMREELIEFRHYNQFLKVMSVAGLDAIPFWELVSLRRLRDTGLERAFDRVAGQIIGAVPMTCGQQGLGLPQPDLR